ncbi:MAG: RluA family pseudouridine synthase [bacterium]
MIRDTGFTVTAEEAGQRFDSVLQGRFPSASRAFCREAAETGQVLVNGRPCLKGHKLRLGDGVTVESLKEARDNRVRSDASVPVRIVFEDGHLIAANKPAGQPVHPLTSEETGTLMNGLVARYPELAELGDQPLMAGALHRIDTGTSGLVLAARTQAAFDDLRAQFEAQEVAKIYLALVEGHVAVAGRLTHDLAHHPAFRGKMVDAQSLATPDRRMRAETSYRPLELAGRDTLLEVAIRTGVTHQIRCQLALGGFPVVNDTLYGAKPVENCTRHFLHAYEIRFRHPATGQPCCIRVPLSLDFQEGCKAPLDGCGRYGTY